MKHRHLTHERFTLAAIEDILARGRMPDWVPLITAIEHDPYGAVAEKTYTLCARPLYGAPVFRRVIRAARQQAGDPPEGRNDGVLAAHAPEEGQHAHESADPLPHPHPCDCPIAETRTN